MICEIYGYKMSSLLGILEEEIFQLQDEWLRTFFRAFLLEYFQ